MGGFRGLELRRAAAVVHSTVAALPGSGPLGQLALLSATARPLSENPPCSCTSSLALDLVKKKCLRHQIYFPVFKKVLNPVSSFKLKNKFCSGPLFFFLRSCVGTIVQIQVVFLPWVQRAPAVEPLVSVPGAVLNAPCEHSTANSHLTIWGSAWRRCSEAESVLVVGEPVGSPSLA